MNWFHFAILSLSAWRIAHLLVFERGPFGLIDRFRSVLAADKLDTSENEQSQVFACVLCMTFYTVALSLVLINIFEPLVMALAAWGAASIFELATRKE